MKIQGTGGCKQQGLMCTTERLKASFQGADLLINRCSVQGART